MPGWSHHQRKGTVSAQQSVNCNKINTSEPHLDSSSSQGQTSAKDSTAFVNFINNMDFTISKII